MKNCFCTLFDNRYLERGLALYDSIARYGENFHLWVLCMDDICFEVLDAMSLNGLHLIKLDKLEREDSALNNVKSQRTPVEYYFSCKPSLILHVFKHSESADQVTYIDADTYFFSPPDILYDELRGTSVAITPHRFEPEMKHKEKYGKYNAGWLMFSRDEDGLACLNWWRERCIEWCHDKPEPDRFADQKYIDQFSSLFNGVLSIESVGVNMAPWNSGKKKVSFQGNQLCVDGENLVFYHFHNLKYITNFIFDLGYSAYTPVLCNSIRKYVYKPYLSLILTKRKDLLMEQPSAPLQRGGKY